MDRDNKTICEHIGILPIQGLLESEAWSFSRGKSTATNCNCYINEYYGSGKRNEGGFLKEDILSSDLLMTLAFMKKTFISKILNKLWDNCMEEKDDFEICGQSGNYYYPFYLDIEKITEGKKEDKDCIRLSQPDGWISTKNMLVLVEAKGMRDKANFNYAQLAKEYLIAKVESDKRNCKPRILLIIPEKLQEDLSGNSFKDKFLLSCKQIFQPNGKTWSEKRVNLISELIPDKEDFFPKDLEEINNCFQILTYEQIIKYAEEEKTKSIKDESEHILAQMLIETIQWHNPNKYDPEKPGTTKMPLWSRFFRDIAGCNSFLPNFINGGSGNEYLQKYEEEFFTTAKINENNKFRKAIKERHKYVKRINKSICRSVLKFQDFIDIAIKDMYWYNYKLRTSKKHPGVINPSREFNCTKIKSNFVKGIEAKEIIKEKIKIINKKINEEYISMGLDKDVRIKTDLELGIDRNMAMKNSLKLLSWDGFSDDNYPYEFFSIDRKFFIHNKDKSSF